MIKYLILILIISISVFTLVSGDVLTIGEVNFYILLGIIIIDYFGKKSLSLFQVWLVGFIFIILSEVILIGKSDTYILNAVKLLLIANHLIILGYLMPINFRRQKLNHSLFNRIKAPAWTPLFLIVLVICYVVYAVPGAILTYSVGRNAAARILLEDKNLILNSFFGALSFVLPSIIVYYFKELRNIKSILFPLLLSMPIFVILFIGGSRFPLLFSFGGFLIISQSSSTGRITLNPKLIGFLLLLILSSFLMGQFRTAGLRGFETKTGELVSETRLSKQLASMMSPEGVVDMTVLSMTYFETNPHTYGKSILFLTYFWVPRAIWPDKPTMLGNWLIRKYRTGFGEGHSSSFGFIGELYADFGLFSLLCVFFLGMALNWADQFRANQLLRCQSYQKILVGMLFSYVFFFVRSPITATMTFLGILLVYILIQKILFKKIVVNKQVLKNNLPKIQSTNLYRS